MGIVGRWGGVGCELMGIFGVMVLCGGLVFVVEVEEIYCFVDVEKVVGVVC